MNVTLLAVSVSLHLLFLFQQGWMHMVDLESAVRRSISYIPSPQSYILSAYDPRIEHVV